MTRQREKRKRRTGYSNTRMHTQRTRRHEPISCPCVISLSYPAFPIGDRSGGNFVPEPCSTAAAAVGEFWSGGDAEKETRRCCCCCCCLEALALSGERLFFRCCCCCCAAGGSEREFLRGAEASPLPFRSGLLLPFPFGEGEAEAENCCGCCCCCCGDPLLVGEALEPRRGCWGSVGLG